LTTPGDSERAPLDAAQAREVAAHKAAHKATVARSRASGAAFAGGAAGRLLPLAVPMRFFGAAAGFHVLAWIGLGLGATQVPRFAGGLGWPLAALHALTLGVLAMSAIGAALQLMPVATRQPLRARRVVLVLWWLYAPGVAALVAALALQRPLAAAIAALPVAAALLLFGALMARNLAGVRGTMPGVRAMGWLALVSLTVALGSALAMLATWAGVAAWPREGQLMLHIASAVFGFMGVLALGLANILVPMFALGPVPGERMQLAVAALAAAALLIVAAVAIDLLPRVALVPATLAAIAAVGLHLQSMRRVLREGMRPNLGGSSALVFTAWWALPLTLVLALWWALDAQPPSGLTVAVLACALLGWLTSFLFGILRRIVPFLVSMHLAGTQRRAPTPAGLTDERGLTVHRWCHQAALLALALGIALDQALAVQIAALSGALGAVAFAVFLSQVWIRWRRAVASTG
jgi:hypothetical protein